MVTTLLDSPQRVVVMGVAAVGKSTVAAALASRLKVGWVDADSLHTPRNVARMASGIPLVDEDRWPWLDRVGQALVETAPIVTCSALRRSYRDRLRVHVPDAFFLHLDVSEDVLRNRATGRIGHYMPVSLLSSQLATLEPLEQDEIGAQISTARPLNATVSAAVSALEAWQRRQ